jgi:hypothetical protein
VISNSGKDGDVSPSNPGDSPDAAGSPKPKRGRWRSMALKFFAYTLTPSVVFGGLGVLLGRTTDFAETLIKHKYEASEKRAEEARAVLRDRIKEPPKTSEEATGQIGEISTLAKIVFPSGEAHDMLVAWLGDLEVLRKNLKGKEVAEEEQRRQLALAAAAEKMKSTDVARKARVEVAKQGREIENANKAAGGAAERIVRRTLRF